MAIDGNATSQEASELAPAHEIVSSQQTTCCVVGGGPAGVILSYMLGRKGISVMLLEAHKDFDRDFRGDSVHPSTLQIMYELGLADRLLQIPHTEISRISVRTASGMVEMGDFSHLKVRYPYIALMSQALFLDFIVNEAKRYPDFQVVMNAKVSELIEENGAVRGVRYRGPDGWHEVRALLTVAADGRFSKLRQLGGFESVKTSPPMDILWFRLPHNPEDPPGAAMGRFGRGAALIELDRGDYWQMGYVIPKGAYHRLHEAGLDALRQSVAEIAPELAERMNRLQDWKEVSLLSVESSRVKRWYQPGLLLIGDAAHVMSPMGGNGINYAIQDAVVAANKLTAPLKGGSLRVQDLAAVQRSRELPTRIAQGMVTFLQKRVIAEALNSDQPFNLPPLMRLTVFRNLMLRMIGIGIVPVHVKD